MGDGGSPARLFRSPSLCERSRTVGFHSMIRTPDVDGEEEEESSGDEFEFRPFPALDVAPADEVFSNGRIRPTYPVFGRHVSSPPPSERAARVSLPLRRLMLEERNSSIGSTSSSSSSLSSAELDGVDPESYCLWTPGSSPRPITRRKSASTGSRDRWRQVSQLVLGRSKSARHETIAPISTPAAAVVDQGEKKTWKNKKNQSKATELDMVTAHRIYYGKAAAAANSDGRKPFLPYKRDIFGGSQSLFPL